MPTSAPGSKPGPWRKRGGAGFTLIELLVVLAIIAIAAAAVTFAVRDPDADQLEREAERFTALLETARAEARGTGLAVSWMTVDADDSTGDQFRFSGLPASKQLPTRWLSEGITVEIENATGLVLGPEPMIGAQRLWLRLGDRQLLLATDGLGPFARVDPDPAQASP